MTMIEDHDIRKLLDAGRAAVKSRGVSEDLAKKALDAIYSSIPECKDAFELSTAINEQLVMAEGSSLQQYLISLRNGYEEQLLLAETARINKAFEQGSEDGWRALIHVVAEAVAQVQPRFGEALCAQDFPVSRSNRQAFEALRKLFPFMTQNRWGEMYEQIRGLSNLEFLPRVTRAKLYVVCGLIQLYVYSNFDRGRELLDAAEGLAQDDFDVLYGTGGYWVMKRDPDRAAKYFNRALETAPKKASGYLGLGECFEKQDDLVTAREWYLETIKVVPGDSAGYERLLKLYGFPAMFKEHEGELSALMQRSLLLSPEHEYQLDLDVGFCYEQNERFQEARKWYEKAVSLAPTWPRAYVSIAQLCGKQAAKGKDDDFFKEAEALYKKSIEVAPEYCDGYYGLTSLYENHEKWREALEWYGRFPMHIEEWANLARAKIGEMHWKLQNYSLAEDVLKRELELRPDNSAAKNLLQILADDYYKKLKDKESAKRINEELRRLLRDSYEAEYHNWLGNMSYFYGEYTEAANEYHKAIAANSNTAIYHQNLSEAYRQLKRWTEARQYLDAAYALEGESRRRKKDTALLLNAEANECYAKGDYRQAINLYRQAIEFDAGDAVIHANLGGAWEQIKEPGTRLEAVEKAIEAYDRANKIRPSTEYEKKLARMQTTREFALRYGTKVIEWYQIVTPIAVEVARELIPLVEGTGSSLSEDLIKHVAEMRARLQNKFGVRIPSIRFRGNETDMPPQSYLFMINEIPLVLGTVELDRRFFAGSADTLAAIAVTGNNGYNPLDGQNGSWIPQSDWARLETDHLELWDVLEYLIRHLESVIQRNLVEFLGHQEVMELVQIASPESVDELRDSPDKLAALTSVCRSLLTEGVPIQPFNEVFETFEALYSTGAGVEIVESIRSLPEFRTRLLDDDSRFKIVTVGPHFENDIRNSIYTNGSGSILAMEPQSCQETLRAVRNEIGSHPNLAVVVEDPHVRPFLRLLLELEFPNNPVLSRREVDSDLETAGQIELDEPAVPSKPEFSRGRNIEISNNGHESAREIFNEKEIGITVFVNENTFVNETGADEQPVEQMFSLMQEGIFYELGILVPGVRVEVDPNLKIGEFRFNLNARKYDPIQGLKPNEILVNEVTERLALLDIESRQAFNPVNGNECAIAAGSKTTVAMCHEAGLSTWGAGGFLVLALSAEIRRNASTFQTLETTTYMLESVRVFFPELIAAALKRFSVEQICLVLKDLLDEEISIRDLRSILESMLSIRGTTDVDGSRYIIFIPPAHNLCPVSGGRSIDNLTVSDYSNFVRASLKRYISHKYTKGSNTLIVYLLDPAIEKRLSTISTQPLTESELQNLKDAIDLEVGGLPPATQNPVLLTSMEVRKPLRKLIYRDHPHMAVLSYQELSPDINIQPIARISWD